MAVLQSGSGEVGQLLKKGNPIFLHESDVPVSEAINQDKAKMIDSDVYKVKPYLLHPMLPDTRVEIAIPLSVKGRAIGAIRICSCVPDSFSEKDIAIFIPIAEEVAPICAELLIKLLNHQ